VRPESHFRGGERPARELPRTASARVQLIATHRIVRHPSDPAPDPTPPIESRATYRIPRRIARHLSDRAPPIGPARWDAIG